MKISNCISDRVRVSPPHAVYTDNTFRRKWGKLNDSQTTAYMLAYNDHQTGRLSFERDHHFAVFQQYKIKVENNFFYFTVRHSVWFIFHEKHYHEIRQIPLSDVGEHDKKLVQILPNANFNSENAEFQGGPPTKELTACMENEDL
jgi:hypothetical protein